MAKEIERKFLVVSDSWKTTAKTSKVMQQGYVLMEDDRSTRVRIIGESAKLTIKVGKGSISRDEFEYDIPLPDAREMLELRHGNLIDKTRYLVEHAGKTWEVDEFQGDLAGLVVAEIELGSETEVFECPEWLGQEVSDQAGYFNMALALNGKP